MQMEDLQPVLTLSNQHLEGPHTKEQSGSRENIQANVFERLTIRSEDSRSSIEISKPMQMHDSKYIFSEESSSDLSAEAHLSRTLTHQMTSAPISSKSVLPHKSSASAAVNSAQDDETIRWTAKAKMAANLELWNDLITALKRLAEFHPAFDAQLRALLVAGYTHVLNERRMSRKLVDERLSGLALLVHPNEDQLPALTSESSFATSCSSFGGTSSVESSPLYPSTMSLGAYGGSLRQDAGYTASAAERETERCSAEQQQREDRARERLQERQREAAAVLGEALLGGRKTLATFAPFFASAAVVYRQRVANEMIAIIEDLEQLLDNVLLAHNPPPTAAASYEQLRGDSLRHVAQEFRGLQQRTADLKQNRVNHEVCHRFEQKAKKAYEAALVSAERATNSKVSALRLGIILNYAVLLHDMEYGEKTEKALDLLGTEFQEAVRNMFEVTDEEEYQKTVIILGLMRDNAESWCRQPGCLRNAAEVLGLQYSTQLSNASTLSNL